MFSTKEIKLMFRGFNPFEEPVKVRVYMPMFGRMKRLTGPKKRDAVRRRKK